MNSAVQTGEATAPPAFDLNDHVDRLDRAGFTIIDEFCDAGALRRVREALEPHLGSWRGRNDFEGFETERVYTLVARGKVFEELATEPRLLALLDRFLLPGYLLTASQAININPGESSQPLHADDGFYRLPRPRAAVSLTVVCAVDAFTAENGATEIIPESHLWGDGVEAGDEAVQAQLTPVLLPPGSALVLQGTLFHRGGANASAESRLAFTNQYCQPWARTQENFYLGVPRKAVRGMSSRLQGLLGYEIWPPFMGQVTGSHPMKSLEEDWVAPVAR